MAIGLDFGTTNSSLAVVDENGNVQVVSFPDHERTTQSFRSLLYLERLHEKGRSTIKSWSGPAGIARYLEADEKGRLIQSLKSFLSSRSLTTTEVFGRRFRLEDLIARIVRDICSLSGQQIGFVSGPIVVGRPVRFVGSESPGDDDYALTRLRSALAEAGLENVTFEYEPVGAAYYYESRLDHDELILIGDFGGGTSDFSLLRVGPSIRSGKQERAVVGNEGIGLAGDAFDAKIIRNLVSPRLGSGPMLRSGDKLLPVPNWVYFKLERWHHLSFLRSSETINMLGSVAAQALEPDHIKALLYLIRHDLGYQLHRSVQSAKVALSHADHTVFRFEDGETSIEAGVTRSEFEGWIEDELADIATAVDTLLRRTGVAAQDVDMVFLTGGSSLVPAVRRIFDSARLASGPAMSSLRSHMGSL